jgi:hypothetical protein
MNGSLRKKRPTEYLHFRPYAAIGEPQPGKSARNVVGIAALKGGIIAAIFVGIPSLLLVPLFTYLLNGFVDIPIFLGQMCWNAIIPVMLMALLAVVSGVVCLRRSTAAR